MKLSTKLLILLSLFLVSCIFATNILLKKEFDKMDLKDPYRQYKTVLEQPFKHVKIMASNSEYCKVQYDYGVGYKVMKYKGDNIDMQFSTQYYVQNDTLFIRIKELQQRYRNDELLRITAPSVSSFVLDSANFNINNWQQKDLHITLLDMSGVYVTMDSSHKNLDTLFLNSYRSKAFFTGNEINTLAGDLKMGSYVNLKSVHVKKLDINLTDDKSTNIELSDKTIKMLMRK
jgi:hypothetical protein